MGPRLISYEFGDDVTLDNLASNAALSPESVTYRVLSAEKPCKLNLQSSLVSTEYVNCTGTTTGSVLLVSS